MKLFLAVPFSSRVDTAGIVVPEYRSTIERALVGLRAIGHEVFCALEYSDWAIGENVDPTTEFRKDFAEIDASDKLVVLLEEKVSAGVQLELGYAYARDKQLQMYQIGKAAWSNNAFSGAVGCDILPVENVDDFIDKVVASNPL
jgi:hypothetical protein